MKLRGHYFVGIAATLGIAALGSAQIGNPSFEDQPNFHLWNTYGDAQIEGSSLGSGPIDGSNQALLATATDGTVNSDVVPGVGTTEAAVESGLNISSGALGSIAGGAAPQVSAVSQVVHLLAGDIVTFSFDFLTNQTYNDGTSDSIPPSKNWNDFAFLSVADLTHGGYSLSTLANTFSTLTITNVNDPFISETGYTTATFSVLQTGDYNIGVGVAHAVASGAVDDGVNSALLVDNFQVAAVPEPAGLIPLLGLAATAIFKRRK